MSEVRRLYLEGLALAMQGENDGALTNFKKALKLQPVDDTEKHWVMSCHSCIAVIHYGRGEMLKAKRNWLKYIKEGGQESWTCLMLGDVSGTIGQYAAAVRYYERCEELATLEDDKDLLKLIAKRKLKPRTKHKIRKSAALVQQRKVGKHGRKQRTPAR